ncbi:unnamed protein product, partial [Scytosiphon promiscuus]
QVFEGVVANPADLFSLFDTRNKDLVDVSEVFASAFLFAAGTPKGLHAKLETIFALFDFDGNGGLGEVESEIMLECVVRGQAGAGDLTLGDLKDWISEREDVAAFLTNFTQARMIISSLELVEKSVALGMSMCKEVKVPAPHFDSSSAVHAGSTLDGARVAEMLRYFATTVTSDEAFDIFPLVMTVADAVMVLVVPSKEGKEKRVDVAALEELLRFWVAFSVVDEDGQGTISVQDLKALLWLGGGTSGEEPPEATVQKTANEIDESQDGVIKRMEWMRYTAVLDEGAGTVGYDGGLLKVFRRYDDDHSGSISANEMVTLVRDSVTDAMAEAPESLSFKPGMATVVDTLFKDVAKDLVTQLDVAGTGVLGWTEFKKNQAIFVVIVSVQTLVTTRLATLREYVF